MSARNIALTVKETLKNNFQSRNSDRILLLEVWESYGLFLTPQQRIAFMDVPSAETIRRIRQKIQEEGKYPPTESIRKHRKFKSLQIQQSIPNTKPENVDKLINNRLFDIPVKRRFL